MIIFIIFNNNWFSRYFQNILLTLFLICKQNGINFSKVIITFLELFMLNGFRFIVLIGVFLAIAGSVQSGDWRYSIWILTALLSVLGVTFRNPKSTMTSGESGSPKDSFVLQLPPYSYFLVNKEKSRSNNSLNIKRL